MRHLKLSFDAIQEVFGDFCLATGRLPVSRVAEVLQVLGCSPLQSEVSVNKLYIQQCPLSLYRYSLNISRVWNQQTDHETGCSEAELHSFSLEVVFADFLWSNYTSTWRVFLEMSYNDQIWNLVYHHANHWPRLTVPVIHGSEAWSKIS